LATSGKISPEDVRLLYTTDSPEEAVRFVQENYKKHLERLRRRRAMRETLRPQPVPGREVPPE
jgi:hypothetical protein